MQSHAVALAKLLYFANNRYQHLSCWDVLRSAELSRASWLQY